MDNLSIKQGGNLCFSSGAWAEGTNANTIKSTATVTYCIDGKLASKAATDNIAISWTGPSIYSANANFATGGFTGETGGSTRLYGIYLDASGNVSIEPGPIVNTALLAAGERILDLPAPQAHKACTALLRIALTATTTFIPGSTDLSAAGVTATFVNTAAMPSVPYTS
jgi:hypothetical protein